MILFLNNDDKDAIIHFLTNVFIISLSQNLSMIVLNSVFCISIVPFCICLFLIFTHCWNWLITMIRKVKTFSNILVMYDLLFQYSILTYKLWGLLGMERGHRNTFWCTDDRFKSIGANQVSRHARCSLSSRIVTGGGSQD